jgi:hypothetical protein
VGVVKGFDTGVWGAVIEAWKEFLLEFICEFLADMVKSPDNDALWIGLQKQSSREEDRCPMADILPKRLMLPSWTRRSEYLCVYYKYFNEPELVHMPWQLTAQCATAAMYSVQPPQ